LYHRLNVIPINIPPLRERMEDIPIFVNHFSNEVTTKYKKPPVSFDDESIKFLQSMQWTGNVRELRNAVERIIIITDKRQITKKNVESLFVIGKANFIDLIDQSNSFQEFKEKAERAFILKQLKANDWNVSKTAEILDIQRSHLYNKMKKYEIERED